MPTWEIRFTALGQGLLPTAEEAKNHFETGRCSDSDGFSARHSSREHGYYEQFRGFRSGPERHSCVDADSNGGASCQEVLSDAINSDMFGDVIGGTVVDLQELSTKSTKSGTSGRSAKSTKSGSSGGSGGSMKGSKVSRNSTKISKSGTGGSLF